MPGALNKTKQIDFLEGLISFRIPENWVEEYKEEELSGAFYEDIPTSGTFRIYLLLLKPPRPLQKENVGEVLNAINQASGEIVFLPNGNACKKYVERTDEDDEAITIYYWSLANVYAPDSARLANFSYTIMTQFEEESWVKKEIEFLNREIEAAVFKG